MPSLLNPDADVDVEGALAAGHSETDIANELVKHTAQEFDIKGAREAGWDDFQIIRFLQTGEEDFGPETAGAAIGQGIVRTAFDTVAGAVSLATVAATPINFFRAQFEEDFGPSGARKTFEAISQVPEQLGEIIFGDPKALTYSSIEEVDPSLRPFAYGGESIGGAAIPVLTTFGLARAGVRTAGNTLLSRNINAVLDFARSNPRTFLAAEAASIWGGATGAAVSEMVVPGDDLLRVGAEVVGSILNPTVLAAMAGKTAVDKAKNALATRFSREAQEAAAAKYIQAFLVEHGEDPVALSQAIRKGNEFGLPLAPALATGSPALLAFQKKVIASSHKHGKQISDGVRHSFEMLETAAKALSKSGDPEALRQFAQLKDAEFGQLIEGRLKDAEAKVAEIFARLDAPSQAALANASREAHNVLDTALKEARDVEKELWGKVPDVFLEPVATREAIAKLREELIPGFDTESSKAVNAFDVFLREAAEGGAVEGADSFDVWSFGRGDGGTGNQLFDAAWSRGAEGL